MKELVIENDCESIDFDGHVILKNDIKINGNINCIDFNAQGDAYIGGYANIGGNFYFSYFLSFGEKLSAKLLRICPSETLEREFWTEKLELYGLSSVARKIKNGCVTEIQTKIKPHAKKILACPYWTLTERLVIMSWLDGEIRYKKEV